MLVRSDCLAVQVRLQNNEVNQGLTEIFCLTTLAEHGTTNLLRTLYHGLIPTVVLLPLGNKCGTSDSSFRAHAHLY